MSTTTETPTTETPSIPQRVVTFTSPFPNLRIVRIAEDVLRNEGGRKVGAIAPGSPQNERYGIKDDGAPWVIQFNGNVFETDDPILIEYLRNHKPFNPETGEGERGMEGGGIGVEYFEMEVPPEELEPKVVDQQQAIITAAARLDVATLEQLIADEKATHNREVVVQSAEVALRTIAEGDPSEGAGAEDPADGAPPSTPSS